MEEKQIHWLLASLNYHLHHLDDADEAYSHIQDLNEEVQMWRSRYAEDQLYNEEEKNKLLSLPTNCFFRRTSLQVYEDFVKEAFKLNDARAKRYYRNGKTDGKEE